MIRNITKVEGSYIFCFETVNFKIKVVRMVQKYQSPVRVYKYPFELVMRAYEMRFPTCDMIPIVRETEIIEEVVDEETGMHMIDRRAKVK